MKFAVVILALVAAAHAQFNSFNNRASAFSSFGKPQAYRPQAYRAKPSVTVSPVPAYAPNAAPIAKAYNDGRVANTLKYGSDIEADGSYNYYFETDNGIAAQQQGTPRNFGGNPPVVPDVAQGSFSWTSPEGIPIAITYVADENGYQPQGAAIPTPPPIPPQIARALEYIARSAPRK